MTDYTPIDPQHGEFCYVLQVAEQFDGFRLGQAVTITVDGQAKAGRLRAFRCVPGGRAAGALVELVDPVTPWVYVRPLGDLEIQVPGRGSEPQVESVRCLEVEPARDYRNFSGRNSINGVGVPSERYNLVVTLPIGRSDDVADSGQFGISRCDAHIDAANTFKFVAPVKPSLALGLIVGCRPCMGGPSSEQGSNREKSHGLSSVGLFKSGKSTGAKP